jgi:hypothetical protein
VNEWLRWLATTMLGNAIGAVLALFLLISVLTRREGIWLQILIPMTILVPLFCAGIWATYREGWRFRVVEGVSGTIAILWISLFVGMAQLKS